MRALAAFTFASFALLTFACNTSTSSDESAPTEDSNLTEKRDCDVRKVLCEITPPQCPAGQTPSVAADGFCYGPCTRITECKPQTFNCNAGPALCEIVPPTCPAGQTLTTRNGCFGPCVPDEVCVGSAPPPAEEKADCDISKVQCEIVMPQCGEGETQTVDKDGFCFGGCTKITQCKPKSFQCNRGPALCEIVPPTCAAGERITTEGGCFGPCVPAEVCK